MKRHIPSIILGLVGGGVLCTAFVAVASRNSSGTMTGISGPYVTGTTINAAVINARLADIETEITNSADRSGRGGFLAAVRGIDGTNAAPAYSFTSETGTGLYRVGAGDLGLAISGAKVWDLTSGGPTVTIAGSAAATAVRWLEPSLANGNAITALLGTAASANASGLLQFIPNVTAANSTLCLDVFGQTPTLCVDGNAKTYIGSTGTGISQINTGVGTFNGGSTATFTATVASGAKCVATRDAVGGAAGVSAAVSGTTLTVTSTVSLDTHTATWICF